MPRAGGLMSALGSLIFLGLMAAVVAIGWNWGRGKTLSNPLS